MRLLISINLLIVFYIAFSSAAAHIAYSRDPNHPGKCVDTIYGGFILSPGEQVNDPKLCVKVKCNKGAQIESYSCGIFAPPAGCILGDAKVAPYPECCNREVICNNIF